MQISSAATQLLKIVYWKVCGPADNNLLITIDTEGLKINSGRVEKGRWLC